MRKEYDFEGWNKIFKNYLKCISVNRQFETLDCTSHTYIKL